MARELMLLVILMVLGNVVFSRNLNIQTDALYFPDQVEYIRDARGKCPGEQVYWPGNGLCYAEGSQGPCSFEFLLVWDDRELRPRCERDNSLFGDR